MKDYISERFLPIFEDDIDALAELLKRPLFQNIYSMHYMDCKNLFGVSNHDLSKLVGLFQRMEFATEFTIETPCYGSYKVLRDDYSISGTQLGDLELGELLDALRASTDYYLKAINSDVSRPELVKGYTERLEVYRKLLGSYVAPRYIPSIEEDHSLSRLDQLLRNGRL